MKLNYEDYILIYETVQKEDKKDMKKLHWISIFLFGFFTIALGFIAISEFPKSQASLKNLMILYLVAIVVNVLVAYIFVYKEKNDVIVWKIPSQVVILINGGFSILCFTRILLDNYRNLFFEFLFLFISILVIITGLIFWNIFRKYYSLENFNKLNIRKKIPLMVAFSYPFVVILRMITSQHWDNGFECLIVLLGWGTILLSPIFIAVPSWILFTRMDKKTIQVARDKKEQLYNSLENERAENQS